MAKHGGNQGGRPLTVGEPLSERIMIRLTAGEAKALDGARRAQTRSAMIRQAVRAFLGLTLLLGMFGCDRPYLQGIGFACDGAYADACSAVKLPICTGEYGSTDEAPFCTLMCRSDLECGDGNVCGRLPWLRDSPLICIPLDFCRTWNGGNCNAVGDVVIPPETPGGIVSGGPTR